MKDFIKIYKKCTAEPYSPLVNDTTLLSDYLSRFSKTTLWQLMIKLEMKNYMILIKKQYDINKETAKLSDLSSGKIDKYEYLTGEEILPSMKIK